MFAHLPKWLEYYEAKLGRRLENDNYLFPKMSSNGTIKPKEAMTHDVISKWIAELTSAAGLTGNYSSHCFRRGGAQYKFMFAPFGKRFSLSIVRWWGGWAQGEEVSLTS